MASEEPITQLLARWQRGDRNALDRLLPLVNDRLAREARRHMREERTGHTLQPTALINEAYLRLAGIEHIRWEGRTHFFGVAAGVMRRILIDHARKRRSRKRGGDAKRVTLNEELGLFAPERSDELLALDEALCRLAALDERQARVVELRFFGGLTVEEAAIVLNVSPKTVKRDWAVARAWLHAELGDPGDS